MATLYRTRYQKLSFWPRWLVCILATLYRTRLQRLFLALLVTLCHGNTVQDKTSKAVSCLACYLVSWQHCTEQDFKGRFWPCLLPCVMATLYRTRLQRLFLALLVTLCHGNTVQDKISERLSFWPSLFT